MRGAALRVAAGAVCTGAGFCLGACSQQPGTPTLCGTYALVVDGEHHGKLNGEYIVSGSLTCEGNGRMSSHIVRRRSGGPSTYVGLSGRWWLHDAFTSFAAQYPPHDGTLIEYEVTAASDVALVGQSCVQRYRYSVADERLILSTVALENGSSVESNVQVWQKVFRP